MYDEIGVEGGGKPVFTHSILLSSGWEVRLRFRRFEFQHPEALLPVPGAPSFPSLSAVSQLA
jgi:hypothetical protein